MRLLFVILLSVNLFVSGKCFAQTVDPTGLAAKTSTSQSLIYVMEKAGMFEVFLSAVRQAGLEEKLIKGGPFTVLAPRDAAFASVESFSREKLFSNKNNLKKFVEQHIIEGNMKFVDLSSLDSILSLGGISLTIEHKEPLEIERAGIIRTDIMADNGVIFMLNQANFIER